AEAEPTGRRGSAEREPRRDRAGRDGAGRYSAPARRPAVEEPWDSPGRWEPAPAPVGPVAVGSAPIGPLRVGPSGGGRHSAEDEPDVEPDYWRPPARYVPEDAPLPADDTPTLADLASRRARRAAGEGRSGRRRRAADAVDGAYWAALRGEAK
ncbi:hypothetical protein V6V16_06000, partial [Micromonospora sp. CPCC 205561]